MKAYATAAAAACALAVAGAALAASPRAKPPARPTADAIKVHGAWQIDVRSRKGKLVRRVRFHNEYQQGTLLGSLLTGNYRIDTWFVNLIAPAGKHVACVNPGQPQPTSITGSCVIKSTSWGSPGSTNLQVGLSGNNLQLSGSGQLFIGGGLASTTVNSVATQFRLVPTGNAPALNPDYFTLRTLPTAIAVEDGQFVNVKVTISFQ